MSFKYISVTWLDAADHKEINVETIKKSKDFLVKRTTCGKLLVDDKDGVVVLTDIDQEKDCEITAIPKRMIVEIK